MYKVTLPGTGEEIEMTKPEFLAYHLALQQNLNSGNNNRTVLTNKEDSKLPSPRLNSSIQPKQFLTSSLNYDKSIKTAKKDNGTKAPTETPDEISEKNSEKPS